MKSYLHELFSAVSNSKFPDGITVRQIMGLDQFKTLIDNCITLRIPEVDILVSIARGKEKSDAKKKKAA